MGNRKSKPKWLKASLELEAAIGDDAEAYMVDESEVADLLGDELEASPVDEIGLDDPSPYLFVDDTDDRDHEHEIEEPPMVWDEDEERYI